MRILVSVVRRVRRYEAATAVHDRPMAPPPDGRSALARREREGSGGRVALAGGFAAGANGLPQLAPRKVGLAGSVDGLG